MRFFVPMAAAALLTLPSCKDKESMDLAGAASASKSAGASAVSSAAPAVSASASSPGVAQARPAGPKYPRKGIKPLAADCDSPAVLLPGKGEQVYGDISDGKSDLGAVTSQLLWANPQFMPVDRAPSAPGEVEVLAVSGWQYVNDTSEGFKNLLGGSVIAVRCHDSETCNDLAALYATVRQWPLPQLHCGELPQFASNTGRVNFVNMQDAERAPGKQHPFGLCARIAACRYHEKPDITGKVFQTCNSAPVRAKAHCGVKLSCETVMSCLES